MTLTQAELEDLTGLIRSGQAGLLRLVSGMTLAQFGAVAGVGPRVVQWSENSRKGLPRGAGVREAYYRVLCRLRDEHGTVTLASPEPCERYAAPAAGTRYKRELPQYRRKPRRAA